MAEYGKERSLFVAYVLWFFLGLFGLHRIYLGRVKSGLLMFALIVLALGIFLYIGLAEENGGVDGTQLVVLSVISIGVLMIWAVWYLADAIFIAVMVKADRKRNVDLSAGRMETVLK